MGSFLFSICSMIRLRFWNLPLILQLSSKGKYQSNEMWLISYIWVGKTREKWVPRRETAFSHFDCVCNPQRQKRQLWFSVTIIFIVVCAVNCSHHEHRQKTLLSETRLFMVGKYSLVIMTWSKPSLKAFKSHWHSVWKRTKKSHFSNRISDFCAKIRHHRIQFWQF